MPNRIIKESICTSGNLNELSPEEEIFFYRLLVNCDDYGLMDARLPILRAKLFPLKITKVREKDIKKSIDSLVKSNLITLYNSNGSVYLKMTKWSSHQQIRAHKSKYPQPNDTDITGNQMKSYDTIARVRAESNPIQSNLNPIALSDDKIATEPEEIFIKIPLNDGTEFEVTVIFVKEMQELYPAVNVEQEMREIKAWNITNKRKRKTRNGIEKHINTWLSNEQDSYHKTETLSTPENYDCTEENIGFEE